MALPSFYIPFYTAGQQEVALDEDNSRHVVQVLRMKPGELVQLTDGRGHLLEGEIVEAHKKQCRVAVRATQTILPPSTNVTVAISPLKNASRFEWFLEKATEIGVSAIIPIICDRTERQSIRADRLRNILVSAMLQSQQAWLPVLPEPQSFSQLIGREGISLATAQAGGGGLAARAAGAGLASQAAGAGLTAQSAAAALTAQGADDGLAAQGGEACLASARSSELRLIAHCLEAPRATATLAAVVRERLMSNGGEGHPSAAGASLGSGESLATGATREPGASLGPGASLASGANLASGATREPGASLATGETWAPGAPGAHPPNRTNSANAGVLILIGPEGDFSPKEVETALAAGYLPVSLGQNRLRTETAGVVAATLLCIH